MTAFLALAALAAAAAASPPSRAAMDRAVDGAAAQGFAGEVLTADRDRLTYARAVSAPGRPHRAGEVWRWASVTKQLTATMVMQEVAAGRLALDDTLAKRLPDFHGPSAGRVTLKMLLQSTAGLPNPDDTGPKDAPMPAFYTRKGAGVGGPADALGYCAGPPKAEPGAGFSYNNCDFIVLGAVLERETGQSFAALLRTRIAQPLHLRGLRMARTGEAAGAVRGVMEDGRPEPSFTLAAFGPAGAAVGPVEDLIRFDQALMAGRLLPPEALKTAWAGEPKLGYVALGVWSFPAKLAGCAGDVALVERRGEIGGVEVRNLIAPALGRALVAFADRAGLDFGEIWQGKGLSYTLASAAFCAGPSPAAP